MKLLAHSAELHVPWGNNIPIDLLKDLSPLLQREKALSDV
jgi:hypothetical protein